MKFNNGVEFDDEAYAIIDGPNKILYLNMNKIHLAKNNLKENDIKKIVIPKETVVIVENMIEEIEALTSEAPQPLQETNTLSSYVENTKQED